MPTPWFHRFRKEGQLTVFNKGGSWSTAVSTAITTFNGLGFGVKLAPIKDERNAHIVVKLSNGKETYAHPQQSITVDFDATDLHGRARSCRTEGRALRSSSRSRFCPAL